MVGGVHIFDVGRASGRLGRVWHSVSRVSRKARELDADIYQLHDPELLSVGLKLRKAGKIVIFDSHEDFPRQILTKDYLLSPLRVTLSKLAEFYERLAAPKLSGIIGATPLIQRKFERLNSRSVAVRNYPLVEELKFENRAQTMRQAVCYVGSISVARGIVEICEAIKLSRSGARLLLAGDLSFDEVLRAKVLSAAATGKVEALGFLGRDQVRSVLQRSVAGLVTLHPTASYVDSLPIKLFEYMSAGIPVIASNFPLWAEIVNSTECGLLVNPRDSRQIAHAIDWMVSNPDNARRMGLNGQKAVADRYNWASEERRLLAFYTDLLQAGTSPDTAS
jgi:glycosyltransferase involved in cell wall biosynthesis